MTYGDGIVLLLIGTLAGIAIWRRPDGASDVIRAMVDVILRRRHK